MKSRDGKSQREEKSRRSEKTKSQKKEAQMREKVGKSRNTVFFQCFVAPKGRKVGSLKRRVRSHLPDERWTSARRCGHISKSKCTRHTMLGPLLEVEMSKKCTPLWREAHLQVKKLNAPHVRTIFGSWDVEKVHTVVARSTFWCQNVKNTRGSDHFWTFRCSSAWQAQGIVHLVICEQNVRVL